MTDNDPETQPIASTSKAHSETQLLAFPDMEILHAREGHAVAETAFRELDPCGTSKGDSAGSEPTFEELIEAWRILVLGDELHRMLEISRPAIQSGDDLCTQVFVHQMADDVAGVTNACTDLVPQALENNNGQRRNLV